MNAISLAVSKVGKASSHFIQRRRRSNEEHHHDEPLVQLTDDGCHRTEESAHDDDEPLQNMSLLYSCCKQWAWPAVTFRCTTHPHEANVTFRDKNGDTALHLACIGNPPIDTVEALLTACPELACARNNYGNLPLHVSCSYRASSNVIRALVNAYPEGAGIPNGSGSFPMHILCDYGCVVDSMRAVLESNSGIETLTRHDAIFQRSPLWILNARKGHLAEFDALRREREKFISSIDAQRTSAKIQELVASCEAVEFWQKVVLLILAEYSGRALNATQDFDTGNLIHACVGVHTCPSSLLDNALLLYPEQLSKPDDNGSVPLHVACSRPDAAHVKDILRACPTASKIRNQEGRLPIELAVECGLSWTDGVGELLLSNPISLEALNVDERMYPWIWSNVSRKPYGNTSALYESLRARPSICRR
jgi:ankyrin repeat protein